MKHTFSSNSDLIHAYANQLSTHGRAGNVFFEGKKIYSYGYHYLLGQFIDEQNIMINNAGFSSSTLKHIGKLISATRHLKQWFSRECDIELVYRKIVDLNNQLGRAKKPYKYSSQIINLFESLTTYYTTFPDAIDENKSDKYDFIYNIYNCLKSKQADYLVQLRADEAKKAARAKEQLKADIAKFKTFEINRIYHSGTDYLRINGDFVETSQSVKIDIQDAKNLFLAIKQGIDIVGQKIAHYKIRAVSEKMLVVGCHNIPMSEVNEIGQRLTDEL